MKWFQQYRMEWIAETLRIFGFINRDHLIRKFGLSKSQAAIDFADFRRLYPGVMDYDVSARRYVARKQQKGIQK
jgi:hypothetical protein